MRVHKKVRNIESLYIREMRATRQRQDATIVLCALFTIGVIVWSIMR